MVKSSPPLPGSCCFADAASNNAEKPTIDLFLGVWVFGNIGFLTNKRNELQLKLCFFFFFFFFFGLLTRGLRINGSGGERWAKTPLPLGPEVSLADAASNIAEYRRSTFVFGSVGLWKYWFLGNVGSWEKVCWFVGRIWEYGC